MQQTIVAMRLTGLCTWGAFKPTGGQTAIHEPARITNRRHLQPVQTTGYTAVLRVLSSRLSYCCWMMLRFFLQQKHKQLNLI